MSPKSNNESEEKSLQKPENGLSIHLVGGAVRDGLLGLPVNDKDFVVVGSNAAEMESRGFRPVGKDFPVFLHPVTQDEYALARTERKSGQGYKGFTVYAEPDVTLEQDLGRRDLTINAMAMDTAGHITDPHGGQRDLKNKILRHVKGQAFIEDPVRILRLARFCARYVDFSVHPDTTELVRDMVDNGEMDHLVPERVWHELSKGLMEKAPERMLDFLRETGALKAILPEVDALHGVDQVAKHHPEVDTFVHVKMVLQQAVQRDAPLDVRFACLMHDLGKGLTPKDLLPAHHGHEQSGVALVKAVCKRLKVPADCRDLAVLTCSEHTHVHRCEEMKDTSVVRFLGRADAFRRPERFERFVLACECDARGRLGLENRDYPQAAYVIEALRLTRAVDAAAIAKACSSVEHIPQRIHQARSNALRDLQMNDFKSETSKKSRSPNESR